MSSPIPEWLPQTTINNDNITKPSTPPPPHRPLPIAMLLLTGVIIGLLLSGLFRPTSNQPDVEYRTPPSCITAIDLAAEGFGEVGEGLGVAADSNMTDSSEIQDATAWLEAHTDDMHVAASTCRAGAKP